MKLKITLSNQLEIAKKILTKMQYFVYSNRLKSLLKIFERRLREYKIDSDDKKEKIFIQEGDEEYIMNEKKKLEKFLFSDSSELNESREVKDFKSNRLLLQITKKLRGAKDWMKTKAIQGALRSDTVMDFFMKIGISIKWEIVK